MKTRCSTSLIQVFLIALGIAWATSISCFSFNKDGFTDIVWRDPVANATASWYMPWISYYNEYGTVAQFNQDYYPQITNSGWHVVAAADFNRDGNPDLLWRNFSTGLTCLWLLGNDGTNVLAGNFVPSQNVTVDNSWYVVGVGDFDGDGYPDIVWRNPSLDSIYVWYMNLGGTNSSANALIPYGVNGDQNWTLAAVGDFNNDGYPDLLWQSDYYATAAIWHMKNTTRIDGPALSTYPGGPNFKAKTGIFNTLGNGDIVWWNPVNGQNFLWWMRDTSLQTWFSFPTMATSYEFSGTGGYSNVMALTATAVTSPPTLTLDWRFGDSAPPTILRRPLGSASWSTLANNYLPTHLTNTDLTVGQRYEYLIGNTNYLLTAIAGRPDPLENGNHGTVILVVDSTIASAVSTSLDTLKSDLVGDGWKVIRTDVPRHDDNTWANNPPAIASIKSFIQNTYNADPVNTKAVFLIGHVPVPYMGCSEPDGLHGIRALPTDLYYGDFDTVFHDINANCTGFDSDPRHNNIPTDLKWDETSCQLRLAVGRVDFANMPQFSLSETALLNQYFDKNDRYRQKKTVLANRVILGSFFDQGGPKYFGTLWGQGVKNASRIVGTAPGNLLEGDCLAPGNPCLWGIHGGYGSYGSVEGTNGTFNTTAQFADPTQEPQTGFVSLFGSFLMDYDSANSFMYAFLGLPNYGLGAMWFPAWDYPYSPTKLLNFEQMGLGETIGSAIVRTINSDPIGYSEGNMYCSLMGDPTLRWQVVAPAASLSANNGNSVTLTWSSSSDTSSYFVYRSMNGLDGPWTKLSASVISGSTYTDNNAPSGAKTYQVRAAYLTSTGSGSYTNLGQGIFYTTAY
jgi:hypothetical protein